MQIHGSDEKTMFIYVRPIMRSPADSDKSVTFCNGIVCMHSLSKGRLLTECLKY